LSIAANVCYNSQTYQFESLGEDGDEVISTSYPENGMVEGDLPMPTFTPRPLQNLNLVDELDSLSPIIDARVTNLIGADTPQIYTANGRGPRSTLRALRQGLEVAEVAQQELSFRPTGIWASKAKHEDEYDAYLVLSAPNATLVFSVGESIETVDNTGIRPDVRTLGIQLLADNTLVQVHPRGLELIHADGRKTPTPVKRGTQATMVASNARQIVVALSTGELAYYLLQEGQLTEFSETKDMGVGITSISMPELQEGRLITPYLVSLFTV
jgi:splicing factor 3B subunit 3